MHAMTKSTEFLASKGKCLSNFKALLDALESVLMKQRKFSTFILETAGVYIAIIRENVISLLYVSCLSF